MQSEYYDLSAAAEMPIYWAAQPVTNSPWHAQTGLPVGVC